MQYLLSQKIKKEKKTKCNQVYYSKYWTMRFPTIKVVTELDML